MFFLKWRAFEEDTHVDLQTPQAAHMCMHQHGCTHKHTQQRGDGEGEKQTELGLHGKK